MAKNNALGVRSLATRRAVRLVSAPAALAYLEACVVMYGAEQGCVGVC